MVFQCHLNWQFFYVEGNWTCLDMCVPSPCWSFSCNFWEMISPLGEEMCILFPGLSLVFWLCFWCLYGFVFVCILFYLIIPAWVFGFIVALGSTGETQVLAGKVRHQPWGNDDAGRWPGVGFASPGLTWKCDPRLPPAKAWGSDLLAQQGWSPLYWAWPCAGAVSSYISPPSGKAHSPSSPGMSSAQCLGHLGAGSELLSRSRQEPWFVFYFLYFDSGSFWNLPWCRCKKRIWCYCFPSRCTILPTQNYLKNLSVSLLMSNTALPYHRWNSYISFWFNFWIFCYLLLYLCQLMCHYYALFIREVLQLTWILIWLLLLSHIWLFVTPWIATRQAPLSMGL